MVELYMALGGVFVVMAVCMAVAHVRMKSAPTLSGRGPTSGNKKNKAAKKSTIESASLYSPPSADEIVLNMDAFQDPDLAVSYRSVPTVEPVAEAHDLDEAVGQSMPQEVELSEQDERTEQKETQEPAMQLPVQVEEKPRILGDSARELGMRYFQYLLAHHVVPRGAKHLTSEANIIIANNALKISRQSATMSHGAIAQRIGEKVVCLFEPLENPVTNIKRALELMAEVLDKKDVFVITACTDNVDVSVLAHLGSLCKRFNIQRNSFFIEQPDGSFINYIEDVKNFVPSRLDADRIPQSFFTELLDYAYDAYDEGDHEAILRTVEPLLHPLYLRIRNEQDFPKVLLAQALNLVGMTYRDIGNDDDAVACFELSLTLLREIEDYDAIKSVLANVGITLALSRPVTQRKIESAIHHLTEATNLNPRDDEAWVYLANSYLEQYRLNNAKSLLQRALRAYEKAYALTQSSDIDSCINALKRQIGGRFAGTPAVQVRQEAGHSQQSSD